MSHELTLRANGQAEMAYLGETPWHGLGNAMEPGQTIEQWIEAAGMDWKILRGIVRYAVSRDQNAEYMTMPEKHVLFRSDTKVGLGVVSDNFKTVQPFQIMEFFRDLTEEAGFTLQTAGTLFGGTRFWALASIGEETFIADPRDKVKRHLLASTSCDGTRATEFRYVDMRVVCNNTLGAAFGENKAKVRVTHRSIVDERMVKQDLGVDAAHESFKSTMDEMRRLADTSVKEVQAVLQTVELFKPGASKLTGDELKKIIASKPVTAVCELALASKAIGSNFDGIKGTQWGWLNAVTEYIDHYARARSQENRLNSAWFGKGAELKERAFEMATIVANGTTQYVVQTATDDDPPSSLLDSVLSVMPTHV